MAADASPAALPQIVGAQGDLLHSADGREYVDLSMGYGAVWLGHNHPAVNRALVAQLDRYAAPGYLSTGTLELAEAALRPFLPESHVLGGIYSTGMEAMETALRAAAVHTGRAMFVGFNGSTHGRSFVTAALGGAAPGEGLALVRRLPSYDRLRADTLRDELGAMAASGLPAAIAVEPVQMTGGGQALPRDLCEVLFEFGRVQGVPILFDETLTGLYRCGLPFYFNAMGQLPDVLVIGKGMGNGFPCAAVVLRKGFAWDRARVRPGSTFWNHPLACAAAAATLDTIRQLQPAARVEVIERVIRTAFAGLDLQGRGALWCLGVPQRERLGEFARRILAAGVIISYYDGYIRLLPALTADPARLRHACAAIVQAYADTFG